MADAAQCSAPAEDRRLRAEQLQRHPPPRSSQGDQRRAPHAASTALPATCCRARRGPEGRRAARATRPGRTRCRTRSKKYIQKHQLSERVEQALNNVLAERPRDARRGLADALRRAPCIFEPELQSLLRRATPAGSRALRYEDALVRLRRRRAARRGAQAAAADGGDGAPAQRGDVRPAAARAKQRGDWREALGPLVQAKGCGRAAVGVLQPRAPGVRAGAAARACQMLLDQMSKKAASGRRVAPAAAAPRHRPARLRVGVYVNRIRAQIFQK